MGKEIEFNGGQADQPNVNINPEDLTTFECSNCQGQYFKQVLGFKKLSAILSPNGQEQLIPVQTFRCDDCNMVPEEFQVK